MTMELFAFKNSLKYLRLMDAHSMKVKSKLYSTNLMLIRVANSIMKSFQISLQEKEQETIL
jgi:hypothetical protein